MRVIRTKGQKNLLIVLNYKMYLLKNTLMYITLNLTNGKIIIKTQHNYFILH